MAESLRFRCSCGKTYKTGVGNVGKPFTCKECGQTLQIPLAGGSGDEPSDGGPPPLPCEPQAGVLEKRMRIIRRPPLWSVLAGRYCVVSMWCAPAISGSIAPAHRRGAVGHIGRNRHLRGPRPRPPLLERALRVCERNLIVRTGLRPRPAHLALHMAPA